jgi:hypothetical protein
MTKASVAKVGSFRAFTTVCYNSTICPPPLREYFWIAQDAAAAREVDGQRQVGTCEARRAFRRTPCRPFDVREAILSGRQYCDADDRSGTGHGLNRVIDRGRAHIGAPSRARTRGRPERLSDPEPGVFSGRPSRPPGRRRPGLNAAGGRKKSGVRRTRLAIGRTDHIFRVPGEAKTRVRVFAFCVPGFKTRARPCMDRAPASE